LISSAGPHGVLKKVWSKSKFKRKQKKREQRNQQHEVIKEGTDPNKLIWGFEKVHYL